MFQGIDHPKITDLYFYRSTGNFINGTATTMTSFSLYPVDPDSHKITATSKNRKKQEITQSTNTRYHSTFRAVIPSKITDLLFYRSIGNFTNPTASCYSAKRIDVIFADFRLLIGMVTSAALQTLNNGIK